MFQPNCDSNHNELLHGAERLFPPREQEQRVANANSSASNTSIEITKVRSFSASLSVHKELCSL